MNRTNKLWMLCLPACLAFLLAQNGCGSDDDDSDDDDDRAVRGSFENKLLFKSSKAFLNQ